MNRNLTFFECKTFMKSKVSIQFEKAVFKYEGKIKEFCTLTTLLN